MKQLTKTNLLLALTAIMVLACVFGVWQTLQTNAYAEEVTYTDIEFAPNASDIGGAQDGASRYLIWLSETSAFGWTDSEFPVIIDGVEQKVGCGVLSGRLVLLLPYSVCSKESEHIVVIPVGSSVGTIRNSKEVKLYISGDNIYIYQEFTPEMTVAGAYQPVFNRWLVNLNVDYFTEEGVYGTSTVTVDGVEKTAELTTYTDSGKNYFALLLSNEICSRESPHTVVLPKGAMVTKDNVYAWRTDAALTFYCYNFKDSESGEKPYLLHDFTSALHATEPGGAQDDNNRYLIRVSGLSEVVLEDKITVKIDGVEQTITATPNGADVLLLLPYEICAKDTAHEIVLPAGTIFHEWIDAYKATADLTIYIKGNNFYTEASPEITVKLGGTATAEQSLTAEAGAENNIVVEAVDFFGTALTPTVSGLSEALPNGKFILKDGETTSVYTVTVVATDAAHNNAEATYTFTVTVKDTTAPVITVDSASKTQYREGDALQITASALDSYDGTVEISYDYAGALDENNKLKPGNYTLTLTAKDASNNTVTETIDISVAAVYDVSVAANIANGTVSVDKTQVTAGELVTITINPADNYEIDSVSVNGTALPAGTNGKYTFTPSADSVVTATFKVITYTVTFDGENGAEYGFGTKVTKPTDPTKAATAQYTYTFDGWYNGEAKWNFETDTITGNLSLTSKFSQSVNKYTVTVNFEGIDGKEAQTLTLEYGAKVDLSQFDEENYTKTVYSGETEINTLTVNSDATIKVVYAKQGGGMSGWAWAGIAVGVVLIACAIVFVLKKKKG